MILEIFNEFLKSILDVDYHVGSKRQKLILLKAVNLTSNDKKISDLEKLEWD